MTQEPIKANVIFLFGNQDEKAPFRAAELYNHGYAPTILVTGSYGLYNSDTSKQPEAFIFAELLKSYGVPSEAIILETAATNTGENIQFEIKTLADHGIEVNSAILISRPFMMKRIKATFAKLFPDIATVSCPSQYGLDQWQVWMDEKTPGRATKRLMAEIGRLVQYPKDGFMVEVEVPSNFLMDNEQLIFNPHQKI